MNGCRVDCIAEATFVIIGTVPRCVIDLTRSGDFSEHDLEPMTVQLTACKRHVRDVRHWISHLPDGIADLFPELDMYVEPIVCSTDFYRHNVDQIVSDLGPDMPLWSMVKVAV